MRPTSRCAACWTCLVLLALSNSAYGGLDRARGVSWRRVLKCFLFWQSCCSECTICLHTFLYLNMRQDIDQALLSSRTEQNGEQEGNEEEEKAVRFDGRCRNNSRARHASRSSGPNSRARRRGGRPAVVAGSDGTRRRDAEESPPVVVRFPGHDRKKPYNTFHRFEKVWAEANT